MASRSRRAIARRPQRLRRVRPVPAALPDLSPDGGGIRVTPGADRGDARRAGWDRDPGPDLRGLHGPLPRVQGMRGRVPLARSVRPDDGGGPGADRAAPDPARAARPVARLPLGAPSPVPRTGGRGVATD